MNSGVLTEPGATLSIPFRNTRKNDLLRSQSKIQLHYVMFRRGFCLMIAYYVLLEGEYYALFRKWNQSEMG